jgi:hypothetical protein
VFTPGRQRDVFRDEARWAAIRNRVLVEGASRRQVARETGMSMATICKVLAAPHPPSPIRGLRPRPKLGPYMSTVERMLSVEHSPGAPTILNARLVYEEIRKQGYSGSYKAVGEAVTKISRRKFQHLGYIYDAIVSLDRARSIKYLHLLSLSQPPVISLTATEALARACRLITEVQWKLNRRDVKRRLAWEWMHDLTQGRLSLHELRSEIPDTPDLERVFKQVRDGRAMQRKKAAAILAHKKGINKVTIYTFLDLNKATLDKTLSAYEAQEVDRIFAKRRVLVRKSESETLKNTIFSVLHQPPREYGFNRTTWNMKTLREALKTRGQPVGS